MHVLSHCIQRGSLVFDYMSVHETPRGPAVFRLDEHVRRFLASVGARRAAAPRRTRRRSRPRSSRPCARTRAATAVKMSAYLPSIEVDVVPVDEHVALAIAAYDPVADVLRPKGVEPTPASAPLRVWIEKERRNRRPDILPPQAKVAGELHLADGGEVGGARGGLRRDPARRRAGLRRRGPDRRTSSWSTRDGVLRTPPEETVLLGVTRALDPRARAAEGRKVRRGDVPPRGALRGGGGLPHRHDRRRLADRVGRRPRDRRRRPGPVEPRLGERFARVVRGRDPAFAHWLTLRRTRAAACGSSPASSPRASPTSATTSARCASTWRSRRAGEAIYFIADYHSMTTRARRRRAPPPRARARARLPGLRPRPARARSSTASPTCPRSASSPGCSRR